MSHVPSPKRHGPKSRVRRLRYLDFGLGTLDFGRGTYLGIGCSRFANPYAKTAMTDYLALRGEAGLAKSRWLFPSFGNSGHLTRQHFARELKALAAAEVTRVR